MQGASEAVVSLQWGGWRQSRALQLEPVGSYQSLLLLLQGPVSLVHWAKFIPPPTHAICAHRYHKRNKRWTQIYRWNTSFFQALQSFCMRQSSRKNCKSHWKRISSAIPTQSIFISASLFRVEKNPQSLCSYSLFPGESPVNFISKSRMCPFFLLRKQVLSFAVLSGN